MAQVGAGACRPRGGLLRTLVARHGVAPRAFLVAPVVGAFFIDFTNALIINAFLNLLG